jgi:putative RecB family exonuclease
VGIEAFTGTMVHQALQHLYERAEEGEVLGAEELQSHFLSLWKENYDPSKVKIIKKGSDCSEHCTRGRVALMAYHRRHHPFDRGRTVGLEQEIGFPLRGSRDHRFTGFIDRLTSLGDGAYEVVDYKTGKWLPTPGDLKRDRQLALYELGVRQNFPAAKTVKLVWHYLAYDKELVSTRTAEELEDLEREVCSLVERIEAAEDFPARRGPLCRWCEYSEMCF